MIRTLLGIKWLSLKRDYAALGLTFAVPLAFFTVFAGLFGGLPTGGEGQDRQRALKILVVDEDQSEGSRRFIAALRRQSAVEVSTAPGPGEQEPGGPEPSEEPWSREDARRLVRSGRFAASVAIPAGWARWFGSLSPDRPAVELVYDAANPMARHSVNGLVQVAAMEALPDLLVKDGFRLMDQSGSGLTPEERRTVDGLIARVRSQLDEVRRKEATGAEAPGGPAAKEEQEGFRGMVRVEASPARAEQGGTPARKTGSLVSYYAAGLGVMFLLFSVVGAGGALLEEESRGTLERLLAGNVRMPTILLGNWLFTALVGVAQVSLMFVWGAVLFRIDLWSIQHLTGFAVMTVATAAAAAGFGLVLAACCKSQAQLNGFATILVMVMAALGGSMVPRFVMPSFLDTTAKFTFNGWALDGYLKVFWYDDPTATLVQSVAELLPQVGALAASTLVFLLVARLLARRWEVV
jgi:ABC-2 type transport system permease protein